MQVWDGGDVFIDEQTRLYQGITPGEYINRKSIIKDTAAAITNKSSDIYIYYTSRIWNPRHCH